MMTKDGLIAFEAEIAAAFNAGKIRAPIHLSGGNEEQLIEIFEDVKPDDWVISNWRSHYHCLLKGVPPNVLMNDIFEGRSITLCYPEYRVLSSAIVGGGLPIATGIALGIKRRPERPYRHVWAFCGDMTSLGGMAHESVMYARAFRLPITFIVEDNGKSVCTDTQESWGNHHWWLRSSNVRSYHYKLPWPHSGAGVRVNF